jgi:HlyD family secretion protein
MSMQLFRKEALQKLSTPNSLDERVSLIAPGWWYTLAALCILLGIAIMWGWLGRISTQVHGSGMLLEKTEFYHVISSGNGILKSLQVNEGAQVAEGEVLAVLALPLDQLQLDFRRQRFERMQQEEKALLAMAEENRTGRLAFFETIRTGNADSIRNLENILQTLSELAKTYESFSQEGMVTQMESLRMLQDLVSTSINVTRQQQDNMRTDLEKTDFDLQFAREIWQKQQQLMEIEHELLSSIAAFNENSLIKSPAHGVVTALHKSPGDHMGAGEVLALIKPSQDAPLHVRALIPATESKNVRLGQRVYIAPAHIQPQRSGYMLGEVTSIRQYPATFEQALNIFKNADLTRMLQGQGVAVAIEVELIPDAQNTTGVRWTGREPRDLKISAGTICQVSVAVEQRTPVSYVLPWIRQHLLGDVKRDIGGNQP